MIPSSVLVGGHAGRAGHCKNQRRIRGQCIRWSGDLSFPQEHRRTALSWLYFQWYHANSSCIMRMARSLASTDRLRVSSFRGVVLYENVSLLYHLESFGLLSAYHKFCALRIRAFASVRSPVTVGSAAL